jgi:hypothetical protein
MAKLAKTTPEPIIFRLLRSLFAKISLFYVCFSLKQQLWIENFASDDTRPLRSEAGMRIWRAFKVFYQVITDREIYFLLGLAIRDLFRKTKSDPKPAVPVKKRAKAMSAGKY